MITSVSEDAHSALGDDEPVEVAVLRDGKDLVRVVLAEAGDVATEAADPRGRVTAGARATGCPQVAGAVVAEKVQALRERVRRTAVGEPADDRAAVVVCVAVDKDRVGDVP